MAARCQSTGRLKSSDKRDRKVSQPFENASLCPCIDCRQAFPLVYFSLYQLRLTPVVQITLEETPMSTVQNAVAILVAEQKPLAEKLKTLETN